MGYDSSAKGPGLRNGSFPPFLQVSAKIGQLKNSSFLPFLRAIRKWRAPGFVSVVALALTACGTSTPHPTTPGEHVVIQKVYIDVPRPCPVKKPVRPAKLKRPLPSDPAALAELLMAKLLEWSGPGGFGDQASDAIDTCIKP